MLPVLRGVWCTVRVGRVFRNVRGNLLENSFERRLSYLSICRDRAVEHAVLPCDLHKFDPSPLPSSTVDSLSWCKATRAAIGWVPCCQSWRPREEHSRNFFRILRTEEHSDYILPLLNIRVRECASISAEKNPVKLRTFPHWSDLTVSRSTTNENTCTNS